MKSFSFKRTMIRGIILALPLAIVFFVLIRVFGILENMITPLAKKANVTNILGGMTLTVITVLCILILIFILGLLMQFSFIVRSRLYVQDLISKIIPGFNYLKLIAEEQLDFKDTSSSWKPALVEIDEQYSPAFITEETDEWVTLFYVKPPSFEAEMLVIAKKDTMHYHEITMKQMVQMNKKFGKGYIELIKGDSIDDHDNGKT